MDEHLRGGVAGAEEGQNEEAPAAPPPFPLPRRGPCCRPPPASSSRQAPMEATEVASAPALAPGPVRANDANDEGEEDKEDDREEARKHATHAWMMIIVSNKRAFVCNHCFPLVGLGRAWRRRSCVFSFPMFYQQNKTKGYKGGSDKTCTQHTLKLNNERMQKQSDPQTKNINAKAYARDCYLTMGAAFFLSLSAFSHYSAAPRRCKRICTPAAGLLVRKGAPPRSRSNDRSRDASGNGLPRMHLPRACSVEPGEPAAGLGARRRRGRGGRRRNRHRHRQRRPWSSPGRGRG